ncbi:MAG: serine hydrolase, partial [Gammaproteobacteria bacterium]|nr:serine hydrolase [Gammaproteobacteria bacterium]
KNTVRVGDPLSNISHAANADQVCRLYYMLYMGKIISPERSNQMLEILKDPLIEHKFVKALHQFAPEALLFRKSGTWKHWHADSVMVRGKRWRNYILVAFVEHKHGEEILQKIVPTVETIIRPSP